MNMKQKGGEALSWASDTLDMPADLVAGGPRIEIVGCRELYMDNHKGILSYDDTKVCVGAGGVTVIVSGSGLVLRAMNADELRISGRIVKVELEY